jgi:hypothetical protein
MMWGEGASDLWGHLEEEEYERELEMIDGVREPPGRSVPAKEEVDESIEAAGSEQARQLSSHSRGSVR